MLLMAVWRLVDRRQKAQLLALLPLSVLMAVGTVTGVAAILPFFTALADPASMGRSRLLSFLHLHTGLSMIGAGPGLVVELGAAFIALVALANLVNFGGTLLMNRFAFEVGNAFSVELFEGYLSRDYQFHLRIHSAILSARLLHETSRVTTGVLQSGLMLMASLVTIALIVISMVVIDPVIATIALASLGTTYAVIYWAARGKLLRSGAAQSRHYAERTRIVGDSLSAVKDILLWRAQRPFVGKFADACRAISRNALSTLAISQAPRHALEVVTVCALVGSALYLGGRGGHGRWIGPLSFIALAVYRLLPALQQAFTALVRIRTDRPALESVAADLREARARPRAVRSAAIDATWRSLPRQDIRLEHISFRYEADAAPAIAALSLTIPAGAMAGVIGDNGSGKTTLLDIVAGLLLPESGRICVDGITISAASRDAWQSAIAYVPQEVFLLDATLEENIALGAAITLEDRNRMKSALMQARLQECASGSPDGRSPRLGERGARLSGGQRQRVAIARALYRNASVLLLDEATSELDETAQERIVESLAALRGRRTVILTGHRLSSLRHCDVIFELDHGRLVRTWTYETLQASRGLRQQQGGGIRGAS